MESRVCIPIDTCRKRKRNVEICSDESLELMIKSGCLCVDNCLMKLCHGTGNYTRGLAIVKQCRKELYNMTKDETINHMKMKLAELPKVIAPKSQRMFCDYSVTYSNVRYSMCPGAYTLCYGITEYALKLTKKGIVNDMHDPTHIAVRDKTAVDKSTLNLMNVQLTNANIDSKERRDIIASCALPNSHRSLQMQAWMKYMFKLIGDESPNSNGEIHLEPQNMEDIWKEYVGCYPHDHLSYDSFLNMWRRCFDQVKIREYKQVTGKCFTCFKLTELRRNRKDSEGRSLATTLHAYHRTMYMNEKKSYYDRAYQAEAEPGKYVSLIADGMAQNHTRLPWLANMKEPFSLQQHLQGIIDGGSEFVVYRTFHNVEGGSNLAIHCLLMQLERKQKNGALPPTVYIQVDGGSENANKCTLAMCELLVARRLCTKVVLTRLPVGHTHENIDGKFALIWVEARNSSILTPQKYLETIVKACSKQGQAVRVVDVFVVPDYKEYFDGFIDPDLENYSRSENTQLQFIFDAVDISNDFPLGVKTTYRTHASDSVYEIEEVLEKNCVGFEPVRTIVKVQPEGGTYFLMNIPTGSLKPAAFSQGSRAILDQFIVKFKRDFLATHGDEVREWERFAATCPSSDNSSEFAHLMHVPFGSLLFGNTPVGVSNPFASSVQNSLNRELFAGRLIREYVTTASVGGSRRRTDLPLPRPRAAIDAETGEPIFESTINRSKIHTYNKKELLALLKELNLSTENAKKEVLKRRLESYLDRNL